MPRPPHSSWLDLPNNIWGWVQIWSSSLWNFLLSLVTPSLFGPNILLRTLFLNTLNLCSSCMHVRIRLDLINGLSKVLFPQMTAQNVVNGCSWMGFELCIRRRDHWGHYWILSRWSNFTALGTFNYMMYHFVSHYVAYVIIISEGLYHSNWTEGWYGSGGACWCQLACPVKYQKASCVFNLQAVPANPNSQSPRGGPGAMHSGLCSRWEWDGGRVFSASKLEPLVRGVNPNRIS
jgi:hypothetical protein